MLVTRDLVASKIADYLQHKMTTVQLVDWAESALMADDFVESDIQVLSDVVARLGIADVRAFGLTWDECEHLLQQLGYSARVDIVAA